LAFSGQMHGAVLLDLDNRLLGPVPETLDRTTTVLLPKDYLRFRLTSEPGTDETDAASSASLTSKRGWADEVIERLGFPKFIFPKVHASADLVGTLTADAASELSLPSGIPVSAGCADQPAQAVGNGLRDPPLGSVTIGAQCKMRKRLLVLEIDCPLFLGTARP
jgi:xylulokinase